MCRIGSIKSKVPVSPAKALKLMIPQQEGHDNSGFAMVMKDLYGIFSDYKDKPLLSLACTQRGAEMVEEYMDSHNFIQLAEWIPVPDKQPGLDIQAMPYYIFRNYDYPEYYKDKSEEEKGELLLDTRLALRKILEESGNGFIYSFWPDVLTLKEIGDPADIATYFHLWNENGCLLAKILLLNVVKIQIMTLYVMQHIHSFYKDILFALMVKIHSLLKIKSSKNLYIVDI